MRFMKTNWVDIEVNGKIYNSLKDFGLAIENTNYIGEPVQDTSNIIFVPGNSKPLDLTDAVFGEQFFQYRPINIRFGGMEHPTDWDQRISLIRNLFEGRIVKLYFYTEQDWYWKGKVHITDFSHTRALGMFNFEIPYADPYKYKDIVINVTSTAQGITVQCPNCRQKVYPTITTSADITVEYGDYTKFLQAGTHKDTNICFTGCMNELTITGASNVTISYTEGSL